MQTIYMRFPGGRKKALTLSYDDGKPQDIRLIELMKKNGLKGTFNLNSGMGGVYDRMSKEQVVDVYKDSGMEVAVHGLHHPYLAYLPVHLCMQDVIKDRENLESQFQTIIRGMAYPHGSYNDEVVQCLKCAGIVYSRAADCTERFDVPTDWLRMKMTCHHNHPRLMEMAHQFIEGNCREEPWLFSVWGHSWEFDAQDNWSVMEEFAAYTGNREDIWYATNIEIYEYVEAYERLVYSMDGHRVYNPTIFTISMEISGTIYEVGPGKNEI